MSPALPFSLDDYAVWMAVWTGVWMIAAFVWLQVFWIRKAVRAYNRHTPAEHVLMQLKRARRR